MSRGRLEAFTKGFSLDGDGDVVGLGEGRTLWFLRREGNEVERFGLGGEGGLGII